MSQFQPLMMIFIVLCSHISSVTTETYGSLSKKWEDTATLKEICTYLTVVIYRFSCKIVSAPMQLLPVISENYRLYPKLLFATQPMSCLVRIYFQLNLCLLLHLLQLTSLIKMQPRALFALYFRYLPSLYSFSDFFLFPHPSIYVLTVFVQKLLCNTSMALQTVCCRIYFRTSPRQTNSVLTLHEL